MKPHSGPILGWDVGGANIKAARVEGPHSDPRMLERPFPLWREPHRLAHVLAETAAALGSAPTMAVTMTAELADCFATKRDGVAAVLDAFSAAFPAVDVWVYGVDGRFRPAAAALDAASEVAAANWMAGATLVAGIFTPALFVDVGSTTVDIIPIAEGCVAALGRDDPSRLQTGELVYTGLLRTPVCAVVQSVPLRGRPCRVAAEHFAVTADVHRWLGRIDEQDYTCETPDGRGRSRNEAGARLARVVCADLDMLDDAEVTAIAAHVARAQVRQIATAMRQVVRRPDITKAPLAVLAGRGAFLAREAAAGLGLDAVDLADRIGGAAAQAVPAAAVALLLDAAIKERWTTLA